MISRHLTFINYLSIKLSIPTGMGESHSNAIQHELLQHLQHTYQPYFHSKDLPGHPTYLKITQHSSMPLINEWTYKYPVIDCYQLLLKLNQEDWKRENKIYEFRKATYPYFVQVIYFELERQQCECLNQRYRLSVYTEHIAYRLANFKLNKNSRIHNSKNHQLEFYESFSLDEGIYMLINSLHAYQLLGEQYRVNYPTIFTIGLSEKAQVKVWINENWAINNQNHRRIAPGLIIEEIINLIEERMEGQFEQILNSKYNYMNFTFDSIQQMLSPFTINFHKGKLTLQKKINDKIYRQSSEKKRVSDKMVAGVNQIETPIIAEHEGKTPDRRYSSQQNSKHNYQQTASNNYSCKKIAEGPKNLPVNSPPKHPIKFTYQSSQISFKASKPKITGQRKQLSPVTIDPPAVSHTPLTKPKILPTTTTKFNFKTNSNKSTTLETQLENQTTYEQALIDQKINLGPRSKNPQKNMNVIYKKQTDQKGVETSPNQSSPHKSDKSSSSNRSSKQSSKKNAEPKNEQILPISQRKAKKQKVSIRDITEQFIILLQSDKKIQEDNIVSEFQESQAINNAAQIKYQSESKFKTASFINYIQEIKEEDEEANYSLDENA